MSDPLHFMTTNGAQALAFVLAGFEPIDLWNEYTAAQLEKLGCTARQAWQNGQPGTIRYFFARTPELESLIAAYDDECAKLRSGTASHLERPDAEDVVRIVAVTLSQRRTFADLWKKVVPKLTIHKGGEPLRTNDPDGVGFRVRYPGFKTISIGANAKS
jgi:hypothetical protein